MKPAILTSLLCAASLLPFTAASKTDSRNITDLKYSISDSEIIYPESFENDTRRLLEGWYMKNYTASDSRYRTQADPTVSDETITRRLAALPTVIEMPFNQIVRSYIDRYTKRSRAQVAAILGLGIYYMPIFEQALEQNGLPLELKYLPVIESGLDPNAVSKHGAAGLWQFMPAAARGLDMELNSLVDERRDPYVSSDRAAKFLKDLYAAYGDWSLAIAAYNCGPGTVNKAIRRAGGEPSAQDFWSIYPYLPAETRGYVPMFIAANYVMTYYPEHNISPVLPSKPLVTDTIGITQRVHFNQISAVLGIPADELRLLNPQYRADLIPGNPDRQYTLILPSQQVHAYILSENDIMAYEAEKYARRETVEPGVTPSREILVAAATAPADGAEVLAVEAVEDEQALREIEEVKEAALVRSASSGKSRIVTHKVAEGETIAAIAAKYGTTPTEIKNSNGLRRNAVRPGQELRIRTTAEEQTVAQTSPANTSNTATAEPARQAERKAPAQTETARKSTPKAQPKTPKKESKPTVHTIRSGENLTTIANRYGVSVAELRKANGMSGDNIRAGKTLTIPAKKPAAKSGGKSGNSKKRRR